MVGNFPQWDKKRLPVHGAFSTAAPVLKVGIYLSLLYQCRMLSATFFFLQMGAQSYIVTEPNLQSYFKRG
jgi:hypothetical protein